MTKGLFQLVIWGIIGFLAQFVDGSLGMGYKVFSTTLIISAGVIPALASASVHSAAVVTTLVSGGAHLVFGNVKREWLLKLAVSGVLGGVAGALFLTSVSGDNLKPLISLFLLFLGLLIVYRFAGRKAPVPKVASDPPESGRLSSHNGSSLKLVLLGLVASFVDAVGGGGWGPITTPGLILGENAEPRQAVGTVNLAEFFVTIAISITLILRIGWDSFDWRLVLALAAGGIVAAPPAAYLCHRLPVKGLGILIGLLIIATNLRTLIITLF